MNRKLRKLLRNPKQFFLDAKPLRPLWTKLGISLKTPTHSKRAPTSAQPAAQAISGIAGFERFELHGSNWLECQDKPIAILWGFAPWKREVVARYLPEYRVAFVRGRTAWQLLQASLSRLENLTFIVWGMTEHTKALEFATEHSISVYRMEDGFLRSADLGSRHTVPLSLALDKRGIYFDASEPSDLEELLNGYDFDANPKLMTAAASLLKIMRSLRLSKYSLAALRSADDVLGPRLKERVLVIGQVEDDASIQYGLGEGWTNRRLIRLAREENPAAEVIYRPHPDVSQGFRSNSDALQDLQRLCRVLTDDVMLVDLFQSVDRVYTMTSLSGFEALIHGLPVTVIGAPFYAGWGLTDDRTVVNRRGRKLSIEQLFCAAYLIYPRYLCNLEDPVRGCLATMAAISAHRRLRLDQLASEAIVKDSDTLIETEYWSALFRPAFWPKLQEKYDTKLPAALRLHQIFTEGAGDFFQAAVAHLLAGQMRSTKALPALLVQLRTCIKPIYYEELLLDLKAYVPVSVFSDHLAWVYEQTGRVDNARAVLETAASRVDDAVVPNASEAISAKARGAVLRLAQFEIRHRRLDVARRLYLRLLLSGALNGDVLNGIAEIARLKFDFQSSSAILRLLSRFDQKWGRGSVQTQEARSAALAFDDSRMFEALSVACEFNPRSSEGIVNVEEGLVRAFGELPYSEAFLAISELKEAPDPIARSRALIAAKCPQRAETLLLDYTPKRHQAQQYCFALSWAYTYQCKLGQAKRLIQGALRYYPTTMLYREALRVSILANDYAWASAILADAETKGLDLGDMYYRKVALGLGDIQGSYLSFRRMPLVRILASYLGNKYIQTIKGEPIKAGSHVVVVAAFGPGDEIRFASKYLKIRAAQPDASMTFTVDARLHSLFRRSYPSLEFQPVSRVRSLVWLEDFSAYNELPGSDLHTLIDNTGWKLIEHADKMILTTDTLGEFIEGYDSFEGNAYLRPDPAAVNSWRERLGPWCRMPLIGLSWRSSLATYSRDEHYLSVHHLEPLFESTNLQFVNLQYDDCAEELAYLNQRYPGRIINFDDLDQYNDFEGVAALMACLDLIISPATTVVELAGALGRPTLLLSNSSELHWRKRPGTTIDVWHRSVSHVEGEQLGDKQSLVSALVTALQRHPSVAGASATAPRHNFWRGAAA